MRRFFYASLGILALAAAYHLGAARTEAQSGRGPIAFVSTRYPCEYIWDQTGECWTREGPIGTEYNLNNSDLFDLPFPVSSVVEHVGGDGGYELFVTDEGVVWWFDQGHSPWWSIMGTFGGTVGIEGQEGQSFGSVKNMFRGK